jgi:signal transduction histidine kinase
MSEVEITQAPLLSERQQRLLTRHSVANVMMVLICELERQGQLLAGDTDYFDSALQLSLDYHANLESAHPLIGVEGFQRTLLGAILNDLQDRRGAEAPRLFAAISEKLLPVLGVLKTRVNELADRSEEPRCWRSYSVDQLRDDLRSVFTAMSLNSNGRYTVAFEPSPARPNLYQILFSITSVSPGRINLPEAFPDVLRDLLANARKYSPPGTVIHADLVETREAVTLTVEDGGRGIPTDEIESIVEFGRAGSNTSDVRRMGFGGGLTKALWITKQFGGRFWISSRLGRGTRIRVCIPAAVANAARAWAS